MKLSLALSRSQWNARDHFAAAGAPKSSKADPKLDLKSKNRPRKPPAQASAALMLKSFWVITASAAISTHSRALSGIREIILQPLVCLRAP